MQNKLRSIAEVLGIFLVAASLFAVAYQIHQERKVAIAALNTSQLERFASRFEAGLGSDAFLSMYSKTYAKQNWNHGNMTDIEAAISPGGINLFIPNDENFSNPLNSNLTEMLTSSNDSFHSWIKCNSKFHSFRFILPW